MALGRKGWVLVASAALLAMGTAPAAQAAPVAGSSEPPGWATPIERDGAHPALAGSLRDDLGGVATAGEDPGAGGRTLTVVVEAEATADARAAVHGVGGTVEVEIAGAVKAQVPAEALGRLADADGVSLVREPRPVMPSVTSEGVGTTAASAWQLAGMTGTGVKVAVLDLGFAGYASRLGTELPPTVGADLGRCGNPNATDHGTAVAEIVHDMAPSAELLLVCIEDDVDFVSALAVMAAAGVDVVNGSFGFTGAGRGDGNGGPGTVARAVRDLRAQGVLYIASAGNYGGAHWHGPAVGDTPGGGGGDLVNVTADDVLTFLVGPNGTAQVVIQWDSWTGPMLDLDLYVGNNACDLVGYSQGDQTAGAPPVEFVTFQNCLSSTTTFELIVDRYAGTGTPRLDVYVAGEAGGVEAATGSNVAEPASSTAVLAVGAHCFATGATQPYSSTGPTIDGRIKPDISGPDGTSSSVYGGASGCTGGFTGTSAASPHVAGAAALLLEANPALDVAELQQLLLDRAVDGGSLGDDNQFGAGRLAMGPAGWASTPTPAPLTAVPPLRLYDTRPGQVGVAESPDRSTPVGAGQFLEVWVRGFAGVPGDAVAAVLNVTVTQPTAAGYLSVQPGTNQPTTSNLNFEPGQTVAQHVTATIAPDGRVRFFNASGSAHVVVDLSGWYGPSSASGPATARFSTLAAPARAFDSRPPGSGQQFSGYAEVVPRTTPLANGEFVDVELDLPGGVPSGATAAVVNLTVTGATGGGWITTYPTGSAEPATSSINFSAGQTVANLVVAPLDANGRLRLRASGGPVHVIIDTIGWFQPNVGAGYIALDPPARQLDTRFGNGSAVGPLAAGAPHEVQVGRYQGVPLDAKAVALGVVAVTPTAFGWLTVFPTGQAQPLASNLNFAPGSIVPNAVVAGLGGGGRVSIANSHGSTHVISDVYGYFLDPVDVPVPPPT